MYMSGKTISPNKRGCHPEKMDIQNVLLREETAGKEKQACMDGEKCFWASCSLALFTFWEHIRYRCYRTSTSSEMVSRHRESLGVWKRPVVGRLPSQSPFSTKQDESRTGVISRCTYGDFYPSIGDTIALVYLPNAPHPNCAFRSFAR